MGSFEESKRQDGETGKISSQSEFLQFLHLTLVWVNVIALFFAQLKRRCIPPVAPDKHGTPHSSVHTLEEHTAGGSAELASGRASKHLQ
jgi:hypothetical protein